MKELRLDGRKALVTGASRGIGKAIALQLAQDGAWVGVHYHSHKAEAETVINVIRSRGGKAFLFKADLSDPLQAMNLAKEAWGTMGNFDILINNAGVSYKKSFLEVTAEDVDYFTDINFKSTLLLTAEVAKRMVAWHIQGSIYTITSVNGIQPSHGFTIYGATKGALETLMRGVALELAGYGIRVNTVVVGAVETDINSGVWKDKDKLKHVEEYIPLGRMGSTGEVAKSVAALLSCDSYITGGSFRIDGGWLLNSAPKSIE